MTYLAGLGFFLFVFLLLGAAPIRRRGGIAISATVAVTATSRVGWLLALFALGAA